MYKLLLDYAYLNYVSELYQYTGFIKDFNLIKFVESCVLLIPIYIFFRYKNKTTNSSNIILMIFILSIIIPTSVLYGMEGTSRQFYYFTLIGFSITILLSKIPALNLKKATNISSKKLNNMLIFCTLIVAGLLIAYEGYPTLKAFDLSNVYEIRRNVNLPKFLSYLSNWQTKVISLFLFAYSLHYKKSKLFILTLIMQLLIYSITAHKIVLFAPVLLTFLFLLLKYFKNFYLVYIVGMNFGVIITFVLFKVGISEWPATLFIRRMLLVPIKNAIYVYDYFNDVDKVMLSNSILKGVFTYRFDKGLYYVIGEKYYGNAMSNANTNYIGDAYAQLGLIGILLFSILLGILLWTLKTISLGKPLIITLGAVLISFYSIIDSSLLTSILTNGILIGMLLILLLRKDHKVEN
ncbi:hypothetical protein [Sporosarcina sp. P20a]|uniref:hypothetical protein n=1 Tax=Sporosarcina sp. P20a TaxID=2048256 RepID=UPI0013047077|nr:hypothetical protein [Sporosarcina sp. P20a]